MVMKPELTKWVNENSHRSVYFMLLFSVIKYMNCIVLVFFKKMNQLNKPQTCFYRGMLLIQNEAEN